MSEKNSTLDIQEAEAALWRLFPVQGCIVGSGVQRAILFCTFAKNCFVVFAVRS